ncbi:hypothetical protein [Bartonella choladocola]|uniref:hypothetical protein n=1 Tax=Bartonella choladocola TaxID=2750995 RepID=UPI003B52EDB1
MDAEPIENRKNLKTKVLEDGVRKCDFVENKTAIGIARQKSQTGSAEGLLFPSVIVKSLNVSPPWEGSMTVFTR